MSLTSATSMSFIIEGDVNVSITITEVDGALQFDLQVLDTTGSIGDLNAMFFDIADESLLDGLTLTGADENGVVLKADGVTKVDNFTNMNGEVIKEFDKFDGGIQFGTQGIATDDIRSTSFTMTHDSADLTLEMFALQDFGLRLTSVGAEDGSREDSLKLGGTAPEAPEGETGGEVAIDDLMTVTENAGFGRGDTFDFLDSGASSVLANDTDCDMPYTGDLVSMNGVSVPTGTTEGDAIFIAGSNGGTLMITSDGSVNFSATDVFTGENVFTDLNDGEQESTFFDYTLEGGSTATLEVVVLGIGQDGGGGGDDLII